MHEDDPRVDQAVEDDQHERHIRRAFADRKRLYLALRWMADNAVMRPQTNSIGRRQWWDKRKQVTEILERSEKLHGHSKDKL